MSVYTKQSLVESYPAYNVFLRDTNSNGITEITSDDILGLQAKGFYRTYSVGSVVSYALDYNEDPIEAVADAKAKGHKLHWINGRGACLSSHRQEAESLVKVHLGMKVRFQGLIATIEADHNNNLKFVPVKTA